MATATQAVTPTPVASTQAAAPDPLMAGGPAEDPQATATARVAAMIATVTPRGKTTSTSPDGRWRAEVWRYDCTFTAAEEETAYEELRLIDTRSGQTQVVAGQLQNCGGLGAAGLGELSWSRSSRYLYFSDAAEGVPDGGCGVWQRPLTAYDLESGATTQIAQGSLDNARRLMAFWQSRENEAQELVLWNLENGEAGRFPAVEPAWYRGQIVWSPDGSRLAFIETEEYCPPWGETLVALVDRASGETRELLRSQEPGFIGLEWATPGSLTLHDENDQWWKLDLGSGELKVK